MLKPIATMLFSKSPRDKMYAFKKLFPKTWDAIWCSGHDRGEEKAIYRAKRLFPGAAETSEPKT